MPAAMSTTNLHAPELIGSEVLSVFRRLVLAEQLPEADALQALKAAGIIGLRCHSIRDLWPRAWELRANLSAYDALYVALAEQLAMPLACAASWKCFTPDSTHVPTRASRPNFTILWPETC